MFFLVSDSGTRRTRLDDVDAVDFRADALEVRLFYVGCGEAILVSRNNGSAAILIDGGATSHATNKKRARPLGRLLRDGSVHAIVASHPHTEHANFHLTLAGEFERKFAAGACYFDNGTSLAGERFEQLAAMCRLPFQRVPVEADPSQDKRNRIHGLGRDLEVRMLRLERPETSDAYRSVMTWIKFRKARLLFAGHAGVGYEEDLLSRLRRISRRAHLLKVARHGDRGGTSRKLVEALRPAMAVVSSHINGRHRLHEWVRRRLAGARIFATHDTARRTRGDVIVRTDGATWCHGDHEGILFEVEAGQRPRLGRVR